jgi:PAS domain S-box-containing protein
MSKMRDESMFFNLPDNLPMSDKQGDCEAILFHLADGTIFACNSSAESILGFSAAQMQGCKPSNYPWQAIQEDGSPFTHELYPAMIALQTGSPCLNVVMGLYQPQGRLIWLLVNSQPLFRVNEASPYGVICTFKDISAKKLQAAATNAVTAVSVPAAAKEELPEKHQQEQIQELIERLANTVPAVLYLYDAIARRSVYVSSQTFELLGYSQKQFWDMGADFLTYVMHPDDLARLPHHFETLNLAAAGEILEFKYRMRHINGEWRWFHSRDRVYSRVSDGSLHYIIGLAVDITEYKLVETALEQSESQMRAFFNSAPDAMLIADDEGRYVDANPAACQLLGVSKVEIFSRTIADFTEPNLDFTQVWQGFRNSGTMTGCLRLLRPDGQYRDVEFAATANFFPQRHLSILRDITSRKQIEAQLQRSEERFRQAIDQLPEVFAIYDAERRFQFVNAEGLKRTGKTLAELMGRRDEELWSSEVTDSYLPTLLKTVETRTTQTTEATATVPGFGTLSLAIKYIPLLDEQGEIYQILGFTYDITQRRQIEEAIRKSEQQVRRVLDSLFSFVGVLTAEGVLIEANSTALLAAGLEAEDVIGKRFTETYWWSYSESIQAQLAEAIASARLGNVVRYDVQVRLAANKFIIIDFALVPLLNDAGEIEYLIPSGIDITERKQTEASLRESEERIRLAMTAANLGMWFWDLITNQVVWTPQCKQMFGFESEQDVSMELFYQRMHPDDRQLVITQIDQAISQKLDYEVEYRVIWPDDSVYWMCAKGRVFYDDAGTPVRMMGTMQDISDRKLAEQARDRLFTLEQTARETAEKANRIKDEFLAILSHELRTPLNAILGWTKLLKSGKLNTAKTAEAINIIERNAELQINLIEDLLDVSRILQGKLSLNVVSVNLVSIISAALETVSLAAQTKDIKIITQLETNIGTVTGDTARLQQIIWNLLSNAVKFTANGGRVEVTLQRVGTNAQITVSDTGKGISPDFLPHIFDYFYQEDSTITRKFGGLGLGLGIVRNLVELHGGTIEANSPGIGQGATFIVKLPLIISNQEVTEENQQTEVSLDLNGIKVLVVDDDADSRDYVAFVLQLYGAEVTTVASALAAFPVLLELQPDVLVSDIGMPQINGYQFLQQIRALPKIERKIPAIALTAYAGEFDQKQAFVAGFDLHLSKPVEPDNLAAAVAQLANSRRQEAEGRGEKGAIGRG